MSKSSPSAGSPIDQVDAMFQGTTLRDSGPKLVEITSSRSVTPPSPPNPATNPLFTTLPLLRDLLQTRTSMDQDAVADPCLKIHSDSLNPVHPLNREAHIDFLEGGLGIDEDGEQLSPSFVVLDASRPWILYWCLIGLFSLGADLAPYRERLIETLRPIQNYTTGGFGGGNGQTSHLAVSYAAVLALCTVGGREAFQLIDRVKMWKWLSSLKQVDGGFCVCDGGEEDVRGVYCALTLISLLGLPTELAPDDVARLKRQSEEIQQGKRTGGWGHDPKLVPGNLLDGTAEYLHRCQTYEGGVAGGPGGMEAHGGYAFCALAALSLMGEPEVMLNKYLDLPRLIHWLSARQYAPEGGFSGRTNKLVDGCYSTWVGGCWALVEGAMNGPQKDEPDGDETGTDEGQDERAKQTEEEKSANEAKKTEKGRGIVGSLWSRDGLVKYILSCCQAPEGGLRDKPEKSPDYYHSGYILLGLASAQNYHYYVRAPEAQPPPPSPPLTSTDPDEIPPPTPLVPTALRAAFGWRISHYIPTYTSPGNFDNCIIEKVLSTYDLDDDEMVDWLDREEDEGVGESLGDVGEWWRGDRVRRAHPVFNVPYENVREWEGYVWDVVNEKQGLENGVDERYPRESWNA
ncbi:terpenoid cyclases/Protein prenyltransferase [Terfezia boudieri ATCC MYA-4762]|uniref:Protein farnesyltransferase subunit beta n=1 Tax=Terfezia boudieri ATCC MYA-4762 TaxID=1051890 RepID=A0A3N4LUH4_9PEZI|nr:terpenoid cyclases/Protein prenyltransferase [Terfezia boudieri ATCC MYA-4762]